MKNELSKNDDSMILESAKADAAKAAWMAASDADAAARTARTAALAASVAAESAAEAAALSAALAALAGLTKEDAGNIWLSGLEAAKVEMAAEAALAAEAKNSMPKQEDGKND